MVIAQIDGCAWLLQVGCAMVNAPMQRPTAARAATWRARRPACGRSSPR